MNTPKIVCFGEVLFDVFPTHKKIGGAPLNVACRLASFGHQVTMISAIGNDDLGKEILQFMQQKGLSTHQIQQHQLLKTSTVNIILDKQGSASYTIEKPVAWDDISLNNVSLTDVKECDAFIFGSLATRTDATKNTLLKLLENTKMNVFDVNFRAPFYSIEKVEELMQFAHIIKMNDDELEEFCSNKGISTSIEEQIQYVSILTNTSTICITRGANGGILFTQNTFYYHSGFKVQVADTVGAGDSFLAALISKLITSQKPEIALEYACAMGALVAASEGANSEINPSEIQNIIQEKG